MDSRRHFLRGLARAAAGAAGATAPGESPASVPPGAPASHSEPGADPEVDAGGRYAAARSDPEWGSAARTALDRASVLVIGAGALGAPVLGYLAGAGVARLGVLDDAYVALRDLHAETIHYTPDVGVPKAHSAAVKLGFLNPEIVIEPYQVRVEPSNAEGLLVGQDLIVDCSNDDAAREVVAAVCARLGIPLASAAVEADGGWILSVPGGEHACRACAGIGTPDAAHEPAGPVAGVLGSLLAREALSRLVAETPPAAAALRVDLRAPALRRDALVRRAGCAACRSR